jgi:4-amino-4-deoxy-L-arabinose transferase-like glycosyltransferase
VRKRLSKVHSSLQNKAHLALILLCLFFLTTRLFQIHQNPPSLYWDEASIGYNAYSILTTGHDEWGKAFPIHFRAFGEFKLPVYIYSASITEAFFGLTPLGIRLPAVLYSLGSLIVIYLIVKFVTKRKLAGLLAAFSFSIMPWTFIFSRTGYEASAGIFFFLLAVYLFLLSQTKKRFLLLAVFSLIFSIYSYNSFRLLSGLTLLMALGYSLWTNLTKKTLLICLVSLIIFAISTIPILRLLLYDNGFGRVEGFSLFPNVQQVYDLQGNAHYQIIYDRMQETNWWSNVAKILKNYLTHFSLNFLIVNGDPNPRNQVPGMGQIYFADIIFVILGFWLLLKTRKYYFGIFLFLLIIAPIPASLFKEAPHALRAVLMGPILAILSGLGLFWISRKHGKLLYFFLGIYLALFGYYFYIFSTSYSPQISQDWQYGYYQIYAQYSQQFREYDKVLISDHDAQPYIFSLVYLKIDPKEFQKTVQRNPPGNWGFSTVSSYNNLQFGKVNKLAEKDSGRLLVFASSEDILKDENPEGVIRLLNGQIAYYVYHIQK